MFLASGYWSRSHITSRLRLYNTANYSDLTLSRPQLVCLYLPLLMSLLLVEAEEMIASSLARTQHELVLAKLTSLGAQFPTEFKVINYEFK
jgi:hypothetical protein